MACCADNLINYKKARTLFDALQAKRKAKLAAEEGAALNKDFLFNKYEFVYVYIYNATV